MYRRFCLICKKTIQNNFCLYTNGKNQSSQNSNFIRLRYNYEDKFQKLIPMLFLTVYKFFLHEHQNQLLQLIYIQCTSIYIYVYICTLAEYFRYISNYLYLPNSYISQITFAEIHK